MPAAALRCPLQRKTAIAYAWSSVLRPPCRPTTLAAFAALFAADYINHQVSAAAPSPAGISAKQATVDFFASRLRAMPDLLVTIETVLAAPGRAAASFVYTGTQTGPYLGVPATGRALRFTSCDIFTVKDGLLSQHWGMGDIAGVLAQLKQA